MKKLNFIQNRMVYLLLEWKALLTTKNLFADVSAGISVACVAIPLSLAIALASGVSPGVGLITAIIAGIVCSIFGGTPLAVSGPAAAMSVLIANDVEKFGVHGLVIMCLLAGLMQLITGVTGLGKLTRFVPLPVISGFTAGIGMIILIGQLPRAFGLPPTDQSHIFDVFLHVKQYFHEINLFAFLIVIITLLIIRGLPKMTRKIPATLIAIIVVTLIVRFAPGFDMPLIGEIPRSLPKPHWPSFNNQFPFQTLLLDAFTIYLLASLETLLSSSAIDKLTKSKKHDPNQELIGQGLGNIAVSLFNGIPVSGVIARSVLNVQSGAQTRRAGIIHALIILLAVSFLGPLISLIPIAALAGVLFSIAFSMINFHELRSLWQLAREEAIIHMTTFITIVFVDLIAGIQAGIAAACLFILFKAAKSHLHITGGSHDDVLRLSLSGALSFLTINKVSKLEEKIATVEPGQTIVLDLSRITNLDTSGSSAIIDLVNNCQNRNVHFYIKGLPKKFENLFKINDFSMDRYYLASEMDLKSKIPNDAMTSFHGRLIHGVQQFYADRKRIDKRLFDQIATQQNPHTLFITCSDSRIIPSLITSSDPGELFIIRNVGNFIPAESNKFLHGETAGLEFALTQLSITDIVICGHANCGAIKACYEDADLSATPKLAQWINLLKSQLIISDHQSINQVAKLHVMNQVKNLKTYPMVKEKLAQGILKIHAWFFDVEHNLIYEWNEEKKSFEPITDMSIHDNDSISIS